MKKSILMYRAILLCVMLAACKSQTADISLVAGTIDEPISVAPAPQKVQEAIAKCGEDCCEVILNDEENGISVWSLVCCEPEVSFEDYGVIINRNDVATKLSDIYHGKNPLARYDAKTGKLWLVCGAMEGTGVQTERIYQLGFKDNGTAYIVASINPYDIQTAICQRLGYTINGEQITLYDGGRQLCTVTNTVTDMNGFDDEQPVWIGEQLQYDISVETPRLLVTPGVKFTTGLVLTYDDMPTLTAPVAIDDKGKFSIGELEMTSHPYEGTYLDEDNNEPNLFINYRRSDGKYDVEIGIFRLTTLDDGIGTLLNDIMEFTATDASGSPIGGEINLKGDTAVVTFTRSTWPLLENGSKFIYTRQK